MKTWNYGNEAPKAVTFTKHLGVSVLTINYNLQENDNDGDDNRLRWDSVTLKPGIRDYASIVSAIVNNEYDNDAMQAIINNYMLEPDDQEVKFEWETMQAFRAYAKVVARKYVNGELDDADAPFSPDSQE
jgi:hypothetical protein